MLARLLPRRSYDPSYNGVFYSLPNGFGLTSAAYTNAGGLEEAFKNAASYACIRVLVSALARSPIKAVRETRGVRTLVEPTPRILARPSGIVATDVWRGQLALGQVTDGNSFALVADEDFGGRPTQLELVDNATVTDRKIVGGVGQAKVDQTTHQLWPHGNLWHMPGDLVMPGTPFGLSPLNYANKVIGTSLAAEDFSFRFFNDGGHPPIALISEQEMDTPQAREYKQNYQNAMRGTREPLVMGSGIKLQELHLDPSETQFIELMRFCVEQACRFWGVPPSMVFASVTGQHMTYANVTQADLHFLKHALEGKYVRWETALTDLLPGNDYTAPSVPNTIAVIDRNAVLKADPKTRFETHEIALKNRFKTINEIRKEEDDPPFDGEEFNEPGVPPFAPTQDPNAVDLPPSPGGPAPNAPADDGT